MKFEGQVPHFCLKEILSTLDLGELADFAAWKKKKDVIFFKFPIL